MGGPAAEHRYQAESRHALLSPIWGPISPLLATLPWGSQWLNADFKLELAANCYFPIARRLERPSDRTQTSSCISMRVVATDLGFHKCLLTILPWALEDAIVCTAAGFLAARVRTNNRRGAVMSF